MIVQAEVAAAIAREGDTATVAFHDDQRVTLTFPHGTTIEIAAAGDGWLEFDVGEIA